MYFINNHFHRILFTIQQTRFEDQYLFQNHLSSILPQLNFILLTLSYHHLTVFSLKFKKAVQIRNMFYKKFLHITFYFPDIF